MNRFKIVKCMDVKEGDYNGPSIVLACASDDDLMLFFPISTENAKLISYVMDENNEYDINTSVLGIYKTMLDSWRAGDKFLSGVIMDSVYDAEIKDDVLQVRLALSDNNGELDSLAHINFINAVILATMVGIDIIISDNLLDKMIPDEEEDDDEEENAKPKRKPAHFPEDKKIVDIAKKIMSGKTKDV
jgi:bifunctional DNase/RNase